MLFQLSSILLLILFSSVSSARVFSFKDNSIAVYLGGMGQSSALGSSMWKESSGASTHFQNKDAVEYNFSGEFGFIFGLGEDLNIRLGIQGLQSKDQVVSGSNSSGATLMTITNRAVGFNPNLAFEFNLKGTPEMRYLLIVGAGYTTIKASNDYAYTTDGTALYTFAADYKEVVEGSGLGYHGALGLEFLMVDNVTVLLEAGYKQQQITKLTYVDNYTLTDGTAAIKGGAAKTQNGANRELDLSGAFVGIAFRFYIPTF
jgi:hypothetical protein